MSQATALFQPLQLGALTLPNRILMAPLTRCRADENHVPTDIMATHYAQRASAGLLIAEATAAMDGCSAFGAEPGIYNQAQVHGWKQVTDAVHAKGGRIFLQVWHGGRTCHPSMNNGAIPVAPSAIAINGSLGGSGGSVPHAVPHALTLEEIPTVIAGFKQAFENAKAAGFDGIEVHGANGYLLDQFLRDSSNQRTDAYGGAVQNRARLLLEVTQAAIDVFGPGRVGVRLSPLNSFNDMRDSDPVATFSYVAEQLNDLPLAYLHLMRADFAGIQKADVLTAVRKAYKGVLVGNMGYSAQEATQAIEQGQLDAVAFGTAFLANPDLPARIAKGAALNAPDASKFYTPGPQGYTDYPFLEAA